MKVVQFHSAYAFGLMPAIALASIIIFYLYSNSLIVIYKIHYVLLAITLLIVMTPLGKKRLAVNLEEVPRYPLLSWLSRIFLLQICLYALFFAITQLNGELLPILTVPHPHAFSSTTQQLLIDQGFFPWALFGLLAATMGYYSYNLQEDAYFSAIIKDLFPFTPIGLLVTIDFVARLATITALASTLFMLCCLLIMIIWPAGLLLVAGFNLTSLISVLLLLLFAISKTFSRWVYRLFRYPFPVGMLVLLLFMALTLSLLFLLGLLFEWHSISVAEPHFLQVLHRKNWQVTWIILVNNWWLAWAPLTGILLARWSRGRSIRAVILAVSILPIIFIFLHIIFFHQARTPSISLPLLRLSTSIIGWAAMVGILAIVTQREILPLLTLSYLPSNDRYKKRNYSGFFRAVLQLSIIFGYFYLPAGIFAGSLLLFTAITAFSIISLLAVVSFLLSLLQQQKKTFPGN